MWVSLVRSSPLALRSFDSSMQAIQTYRSMDQRAVEVADLVLVEQVGVGRHVEAYRVAAHVVEEKAIVTTDVQPPTRRCGILHHGADQRDLRRGDRHRAGPRPVPRTPAAVGHRGAVRVARNSGAVLPAQPLARHRRERVAWLREADGVAICEEQRGAIGGAGGEERRILGSRIAIGSAEARGQLLAFHMGLFQMDKTATVLATRARAAMNYQKAADVQKLLSDPTQRILSKRGSAVVDARTNTLFVQDTPSRLVEVRKLIAAQTHPHPRQEGRR